MGFQDEDGQFEAIISAYDRAYRYSPQWLNELTQGYGYHALMATVPEQAGICSGRRRNFRRRYYSGGIGEVGVTLDNIIPEFYGTLPDLNPLFLFSNKI
jgi:hypothetical protein